MSVKICKCQGRFVNVSKYIEISGNICKCQEIYVNIRGDL